MPRSLRHCELSIAGVPQTKKAQSPIITLSLISIVALRTQSKGAPGCIKS